MALLVGTPALAQQAPHVPGAVRTRSAPVPEMVQGSQAARFGVTRQWVFSSDTGFSVANTSLSGRGGSTTAVQFRPAVDFFVIDNLSVGLFAGFDYVRMPTGNTTAFSTGPRVGYDVPFSRAFSVWPRLGLSYSYTRQSIDENEIISGDDHTSASAMALNLSAPIMYHPIDHVFIGFGPAFDVDLVGDEKATTVAARLTLGGWL